MSKEIIGRLFEIVGFVSEAISESKSQTTKPALVGIDKLFTLTNVQNLKKSKTDGFGSITESFKSIGKKSLGLNNQNYKSFKVIVNDLIEIEPYASLTTFEFIEEHLFDWIIETHFHQKALKDPLNYINDLLESKVRTYNFYFKIKAAGIESFFEVGNAQFIFFSSEHIENEFSRFQQRYPNKTRDQFDQLFRDYTKSPLIKTSANGTQDKAKQLAKKKALLAINALRCFLIQESVNSSFKMLDIEFAYSQVLPTWMIFDSTSDEFDLEIQLEKNDGVVPIHLTTNRVNEVFELGLQETSAFIKRDNKDEVYILIIEIINQIGNYSTITNLHDRIVKIISLFEFIFLSIKKGKGKGQTIIKSKVIPKIVTAKKQKYFQHLFNRFYDIRDKYLHNKIEKRIELAELYHIQLLASHLLKKLIRLNSSIKTCFDLMKYFEIDTE